MSELVNVQITPMSENRKTGPLPVASRPMETCPTDCPFLPTNAEGGGCYGTAYLFSTARRYSVNTTVEAASAKIAAGLWAGAKYLRDRVVGDVLDDRGRMDRTYLRGITQVAHNNGLVPFGYTHAWRVFTAADIRFLKRIGYVMNASVETVADAVAAITRGMRVVIVDEELPEGTLIAGRRLVTCPAETRKGEVTCASCGLCAKQDLPIVIRFRPHGNSKKVRAALAAMKEKAA